MIQRGPDASPELARQLRELGGRRITAGFGPRPHKRLLHLLHLIHEHASAVAYRPISFGNSAFLRARIQDLLSLKLETERLLPELKPRWAATATRICRLIDCAVESNARAGFVRLERACENSKYRRFWGPDVTIVPAFRFPLLSKQYRKVMVITGPGIGLGDEICCIPLVKALQERLPEAAWEFYGFYPDLWKQVIPEARDHSLSGHPMLCFDAVEAACADGCSDQVLALFINFSGLEFHKAFRSDRNRPDLVEIAVGAGVLWLAPHSDQPIQIFRAMDPVVPGNYHAIRGLTEHLCGHPISAPSESKIKLPGHHREHFQIVLSPFTSKPMLLTPVDWVMLLDGIRRIPGRKPIRCRVLPGTSAQSMAYADRIVELARETESEAYRIERLTGGSTTATPAHFEDFWNTFGDSDLVLGIDTFSAHLAAVLEIPAVTLCYERNLAFWPDQPTSLWIELRHDPATMLDLISLLFSVAGGLEEPAFEEFQRRMKVFEWQRLECDWREAQASRNGSGLLRARDTLDAAWELLAPPQRRLVEMLDFNYAWPKIRDWIETDHDSKEKVDWAFSLLNKLHIRRIFALMAHATAAGGAP